MGELYPLTDLCVVCGTGHIPTPCRTPCECRCRRCNARMNHTHAASQSDARAEVTK